MKKLFTVKTNKKPNQLNDKAIHKIVENICKPYIGKDINIQNIKELIQLSNKRTKQFN